MLRPIDKARMGEREVFGMLRSAYEIFHEDKLGIVGSVFTAVINAKGKPQKRDNNHPRLRVLVTDFRINDSQLCLIVTATLPDGSSKKLSFGEGTMFIWF